MESSEGTLHTPLMSWVDEMSVGVKVLDDDHKRLIELLNRLHEGIVTGQARRVLEDVIEQMLDYTKYHFSREESLFNKAGFPGAAEHKHEHDLLIRRAMNLQARFENGQSTELSLEAMDFLKRWLTGHIQGSDRDYMPFLAAKGIS
ncbi:MAG: bacteriohemerythrin [Terracidiphilus sp.]|jgi:hemerythrin